MGLVSDSLPQAERNCLSFLVLAKAGGFFERSSASRRFSQEPDRCTAKFAVVDSSVYTTECWLKI
jgi:hypothetical protein